MLIVLYFLDLFFGSFLEVFFAPILDQLHYCSPLYYAHLSANQYSPVAYIIWFQRHAVRILGGLHGSVSLYRWDTNDDISLQSLSSAVKATNYSTATFLTDIPVKNVDLLFVFFKLLQPHFINDK